MESAVNWSKVNVVSVTYNNEDTVDTLLANLSNHRDLIAQAVLHDNGSRDGTVKKVEEWMAQHQTLKLNLVPGTNVGFGAGIRGACQHLQDLTLPTLCINPDAELAPGTLEQMLKTLNSDPSLGVVTAPLIRADGQLDSASVRKLPRFGSALAYSILGKMVPARYRYNGARLEDLPDGRGEDTSKGFTVIEATTGALMLINPIFRPPSESIFDLSYWMYGEDLQLCRDAAEEQFKVAIIHWPASLHLKGVSSGWPRGATSNRAFHDALFLYYSKNMSKNWLDRSAARIAIASKFALSSFSGNIIRMLQSFSRS